MNLIKKLIEKINKKQNNNYFFYDHNQILGRKGDVSSYFKNQYGLNEIERKIIDENVDFSETI